MESRRTAFVAALLSLLHPGLGQLYGGRGRCAVRFFVTFPTVYLLAVGIALVAPAATAIVAWVSLAILVPLYLGSVADAFRGARRADTLPGETLAGETLAGETLPAVPYRAWKVVIPVCFALTAVEEIESYLVRYYWLEPFVTPTASMAPTILPGDRFYVDKRYGRRRALAKGDLAVFTREDGDDVRYVKRIAAVAGELADLPGGRGTVPEGTVFVLGDNAGDSYDSRSFGPVPVRRLEGKPTQIWFSWDPARGRVRWERLGTTLR